MLKEGFDMKADSGLEEMEEVPSAGPGSAKAQQLEESDEEEDTGPDLKEVQRRMTNLKKQFNKTQKTLGKKGRHAKETKNEFLKLGDIFKFLKFSPKMFEDLAFLARRDLTEIRLNERKIQSLLVRSAKMPRKDFIAQYPDNATKVKWIDTLMKRKKYSKKALEEVKADVVICQKGIKSVEERVGMTVKDIKEIKIIRITHTPYTNTTHARTHTQTHIHAPAHTHTHTHTHTASRAPWRQRVHSRG